MPSILRAVVGAAESNKPPVPFFGAGDGVEWKDVSLPRAGGRGGAGADDGS
ncbi:MAG TPA: hypothetical protein VM204_04195 [Gaiellaceae bacterium]|nr:hypothetical protein [Gaiellaceae bacterium]